MATFNFEHPDHGSLEIPIPDGVTSAEDLAESFISKAIHNAEMAKLRTGSKGLVDPSTLLEDAEFKTNALGNWGIDLDALEKARELSPEQIEAITTRTRKAEVEPLQKLLEAASGERDSLRRSSLVSQILQAASGVARENLMKSPVENGEPPIVNLLGAYFGYEPETGSFAVKEGDGFKYSGKPSATNPYMGVTEFMETWAGDKANAAFVQDNRQGGPNLASTETHHPGGSVILTRAQARNAQNYQKAKAEAAKAGVELIIED